MKRFAFIALILVGCTSLETSLPETDLLAIQKEQVAQESAAFEEITRLRERLDNVANKVLRANSDLCDKTAPETGIFTQTLKSFPKELREGARRELGLGDDPVITYIRPLSPGARAGLKIGDQLYGESGRPLGAPSKAFRHHLEQGLDIHRSRQSVREAISIEAEPACNFPALLRMSPAINAYANGRTIVVTAGMMNFVKSDDELAYIIGHELAHNTHSHIRKSVTNYILSLGGTRYTRIFEAEADYVGLYYMVRAGYDPTVVEDMWRRLALQSLRPIGRSKTHPAYPARAVQIEATRAEIQNKQALGAPILPEKKPE